MNGKSDVLSAYEVPMFRCADASPETGASFVPTIVTLTGLDAVPSWDCTLKFSLSVWPAFRFCTSVSELFNW
ncbi:hypothetical protein D3C86_1768390 [compost metagenome]